MIRIYTYHQHWCPTQTIRQITCQCIFSTRYKTLIIRLIKPPVYQSSLCMRFFLQWCTHSCFFILTTTILRQVVFTEFRVKFRKYVFCQTKEKRSLYHIVARTFKGKGFRENLVYSKIFFAGQAFFLCPKKTKTLVPAYSGHRNQHGCVVLYFRERGEKTIIFWGSPQYTVRIMLIIPLITSPNSRKLSPSKVSATASLVVLLTSLWSSKRYLSVRMEYKKV